jgi:hypothetical protein
LFDEEAARKNEAWLKEHEHAPVATTSSAATVQSNTNAPFIIPAALLQQYPALAGLDWREFSALMSDKEEAYSGRSAFDSHNGAASTLANRHAPLPSSTHPDTNHE